MKALLHVLDLFCLQETKIQAMFEGLLKSIGIDRFFEWEALEAVGTARGVLVVWDKRSLVLLAKKVGVFLVSCRFRSAEDGFVRAFIGIYGPLTRDVRSLLWEELGALRGLWEDPWCIGGDFNVIRFLCERSRVRRLYRAVRRFSNFIDDLELVDLPLKGGKFTWCGGLRN